MWELYEKKELVFRQCNSLKDEGLKLLWFINTKGQRNSRFKGKNIEDEGLNSLRKSKEIINFLKNGKTTIKIWISFK